MDLFRYDSGHSDEEAVSGMGLLARIVLANQSLWKRTF